MTYFQLMSGDQHRDYSKVMLDFGVAIVGPGDPGDINGNKEYYVENKEWPKMSWLDEAVQGDRIVLHSGQSQITAVGEIMEREGSIYHYSNCFDDVDGWNLQHYANVKWKPIRISFEGRPLARSTAQRLLNKDVICKIEEKWDSHNYHRPRYKVQELSDNKLDYDDIERHLIGLGMRIEDAENTSKTVARIEKLAKWYISTETIVSEHEIRTYLVIPFLLALGWSPQKMAIEYDKLDILLYKDANRAKPHILVETKSMWSGSNTATEQAKNYLLTKDFLKNVKNFVVTDGLRYWLFNKSDTDNPIAYMNFEKRRKKNHAYPNIGGFLDFLTFFITQ